MKNKSILSLLVFLMSLGFTTTSCEDMLTPDMDRYAESFNGKDSVYFYLGILRNVQDMVEQNEILGDLRSDLVNTTAYSSDSVSNIINYSDADKDGDNELLNRSAYYKVINQCNFYLAKVDTMAKKNSYYMRREYAQVVAIRAWTYLQLVQTYGKVPFITEPVDNADTGWEKNPKEGWATADNLLDLLTSDKGELTKANVFERTEGYPVYGEFSTGNDAFKVKIDKMRFYTDVILGDLYLLKGQSKQDFVNAAKHYYYFLSEIRHGKEKTTGASVANNAASFSRGQRSNSTYFYTPSVNTWVSNGLAASSLSDLENITIIPSAANSTFGRVLTRCAQIYGFDASSRNTTSSDIDGSNVSTSGSVSVIANYRSRQVEPSKAYENLCKSQSYSSTTLTGGIPTVIDFYTCGDARFCATAPYIQTKEGKYRYIVKSAPTEDVNADELTSQVEFKHFRSIYRLRQVWLRYAEAINRAGFPRMAYAVLRNGLNGDGSSRQTIPVLKDSTLYDDVNKTAKTVYYIDSLSSQYYYAADYIGVDELRRAQADKAEYNLYLNFDDSGWANYGIHELGCGSISTLDTVFAYEPIVAQRIADESLRHNSLVDNEAQSAIKALKRKTLEETTEEGGDATGDEEEEIPIEELRKDYAQLDPDPAAEANEQEILAVETLIADECALETAYEGSRMFDLIRFARHMNRFDGGTYGTQWLAWKIARRNYDLAPYESPSTKDGSLYGKLLNEDNWYIVSPTND